MNIKKYLIFLLFGTFAFAGCKTIDHGHGSGNSTSQNSLTTAPNHITVNVAVVYQDPKIAAEGGKRFHDIFGYYDPHELNKIYKDSMEAVTHHTVTYKIVKVIDSDKIWTRFKDSTAYLDKNRVYKLLSDPKKNEFKAKHPKFDYKGFVKYYGFDKLRDEGKINEVWVWSWPYAGMWESEQVGKNAFWCNSPPIKMDNEKILTIMGFNFERTADLAMHSFGHRAESVLSKVYGRWKPLKDMTKPNNWELLTSLDKDTPGKGGVGNCHFPVNGVKDYDYANKRKVKSYASIWKNYPDLDWKKAKPEVVDCSTWGCSQMGYMSWWYRHFPHFPGVNPQDKKLNNWWFYIVNYEWANQLENKLNNKANS